VSDLLATQYRCKVSSRAAAVAASTFTGIDFLEVLDKAFIEVVPFVSSPPLSEQAQKDLLQELRQKVILVRLLKPVLTSPPNPLDANNVVIRGGVRITPKALWAFAAPTLIGGVSTTIVPQDQQNAIKLVLAQLSDVDHVLVIGTDSSGDFSPYELLLVDPAVPGRPAPNFDRQLSRVTFSFKIECPSEFDCDQPTVCPPDVVQAPVIDYLAKDFEGFRALMLDRLATTMPDWTERNPADIAITLTELLAFAADQVSYFQDAVANEAYLGTARRRPSLRRHARLLDYTPREGSNARTFVRIALSPLADSLPPPTLPAGTRLLTRKKTRKLPNRVVRPDDFDQAAVDAQVFETMDALALRSAHNVIDFYTWSDEACCLPKGATRATLVNRDLGVQLKKGDLLAFVEVRGPSGLEVDADPAHRHVVRLIDVQPDTDPIGATPTDVLDIEWAPQDALPFALCVSATGVSDPISVAEANIVFADHGRTVEEDLPEPPSAPKRFRPRLSAGPLTFQGRVLTASNALVLVDPATPAASAFSWDPKDVRPAIVLTSGGELWLPQRDLLESAPTAQEFVVETEENGSAVLRFGDGTLGKRPDAALLARYRVGNGLAGNIGADAIAHVVTDVVNEAQVLDVSNPLPARGGAEPEPLEEIRLNAPQAFRTQERAVTEADYAEVALRHPEVQRAVATRRFTGSWYTMFVTVDRLGGLPVDAAFEQEFSAFLDRFRLAGYDLEVDGAVFVPLEMLLTVCVRPGFFRVNVKQAILAVLSASDLPDGRRGFFHPDNLTFGQPVFLSQVVAAVLGVPGVQNVETGDGQIVFKRRGGGGPANEGVETGVLSMGRLEIAELDNDPSQPEHGTLQLVMQGGS
jgi:hypothetical protein